MVGMSKNSSRRGCPCDNLCPCHDEPPTAEELAADEAQRHKERKWATRGIKICLTLLVLDLTAMYFTRDHANQVCQEYSPFYKKTFYNSHGGSHEDWTRDCVKWVPKPQ